MHLSMIGYNVMREVPGAYIGCVIDLLCIISKCQLHGSD